MNANQPPSGQNPAQYMPQYAGYMPAAQAGFYPNAYQSYPAYGGYSAGTMDPQYMGYYGMTAALPTATTVPTSQAGSTSNSQDFLKQYEDWKKQYDQWLEKTKDHPDQQQFQQWQQQMQQWQQHLTHVLPQQSATSAQQTAQQTAPPPQPTAGGQAGYSSRTVQSSQPGYTTQTSYSGQTGQSVQAGYSGQTGPHIGPQSQNSGQYQSQHQNQKQYQDENYQQQTYNQPQRPNAPSQFHDNSQSNEGNFSGSQGPPSWQEARPTTGQVNEYGSSAPSQQQSHGQNRFSHPRGETQYAHSYQDNHPQTPNQGGQYQQRPAGFSPRGPAHSRGPPPQQPGQWPRGPSPRGPPPRGPSPRGPSPRGPPPRGPPPRGLSPRALSGPRGPMPRAPGGQGPRSHGFRDPGQDQQRNRPPFPDQFQGSRFRGPNPPGQPEQSLHGQQAGNQTLRPTNPQGFSQRSTQPGVTGSLNQRLPRAHGGENHQPLMSVNTQAQQFDQSPRMRATGPQESDIQSNQFTPRVPLNQQGPRPVRPQGAGGSFDEQGHAIRGTNPQTPTRMQPPKSEGAGGPAYQQGPRAQYNNQQGPMARPQGPQGPGGSVNQQGLRLRPPRPQGSGIQGPRATPPGPETLSGQQGMRPPISQGPGAFTDQQGLRIRPPRPQTPGIQHSRAVVPSPQTSSGQQGAGMRPPASQGPGGFQQPPRISPSRPQTPGIQHSRAVVPSPQTSSTQQGAGMRPPASQGPGGFQQPPRISPSRPQTPGVQGPRAVVPSPQTSSTQQGAGMRPPTTPRGPITDQQGPVIRPPRPQTPGVQGPQARTPSPQTIPGLQGARMRPPIAQRTPGNQRSPQLRPPTPQGPRGVNQQGARVPRPQTTSDQQGPRKPTLQIPGQQTPRLRIPRPPRPQNQMEAQTIQPSRLQVPQAHTPNQNIVQPPMQYQNMSGPRLRLPVVSKPRVPSPSQPSESATKKELANVPSNDENQPSDSVVVIKTENTEPVNTAGNNIDKKTEETPEMKIISKQQATDSARDVPTTAEMKEKKQREIELLMRQQEQLKNLEMLGMLQQKQKAIAEIQAKSEKQAMAGNEAPQFQKESMDKAAPVRNVARSEEKVPEHRPSRGPAERPDQSTLPCKKFPRCGLAENCQYFHPLCKYDVNCKRAECPFWHTVPLEERSCGKKMALNRGYYDEYNDPSYDELPPYDERERLPPPEHPEYRRLPPEDDAYINNRRDHPPVDYYNEGYHDRGVPPPERDNLGRPPYDDTRGRISDYRYNDPGYIDDRYPPRREYDRYPDDDRYPDRERYPDERPYLEEGPCYDRGRYPEETRYPGDVRYPDEERRPIRERYDDPYNDRDRLYRDSDAEYFRRREMFERSVDIDPYLSERDYRDREIYRREDPYEDPYLRREPVYDRLRPPHDHFDDLDRRRDVGRDRYDDLFPRDYRHRDPVESVVTGREALLQSKSIDYKHGWREEEQERRRHPPDRYERDYPPESAPPPSKPRSEVVAIGNLLEAPGRDTRPERIVFIFRGVPGSGKTHIARLIKDKEVSCGAHAPRILSLDDYFLQETSKKEEDPETGKKVEVKATEYVYEAELEESYRKSLFKSFNKTLDDGFFPMVILDCVNDKVDHFDHFWSIAKQKGFEVYVAEMTADANDCAKRNTHNRSLEDINKILETWEDTPAHYIRLDVRALLQDVAIEEVEMEAVEAPDASKAGKVDAKEEKDTEETGTEGELEDSLFKSRWNDTDVTEKTLDKLDGIRPRGTKRKSHNSPLADDFEDDPYDEREEDMRLGKKRVRWADIEERKHLEHRRKIGFCIGTDWSILTNPDAEIPQ